VKDGLLKNGFPHWNKRDFFKFINMCELYGKDNLDLFSELLLGGKTLEEIELYSETFWKNYS
jgi:SWI/SNF-related matrix-associated actin-dependent regulator of chromatin subfamily A member 5